MDQLPKKSTFRWKWLFAVPLVLLAGWFGYRWVFPAYQPPVQPVPNGYDELVDLGGKLARRTGLYDEMSEQELATIVAANEPILVEARKSLRKESVVALDWEADQQWFGSVHLEENESLRKLALAFAAERWQAKKAGNSHLAITCGFDNIHLAQAISTGGLGTDWLTGIAVYGIGLGTLRESHDVATGEDCRYVLKNLPVVSEHFDPPAEITVREWHFWRRINGPYQTFLSELSFSNNRVMFEHDLVDIVTLYQAKTDLLRLHYAIRAFQITEGRLPKSLAELAGRELKTIPLDPFSQNDFIYQAGKDRYLLYSVGPNGIDDGGVEDEQDRSQGDLLLEPRESNSTGTVLAH